MIFERDKLMKKEKAGNFKSVLLHRLRQVFNLKLSERNDIEAIDTWFVLLVRI